MDYEKLAEICNKVAKWKKLLDTAEERLKDAEADVVTARQNFNEWVRKLEDFLKS